MNLNDTPAKQAARDAVLAGRNPADVVARLLDAAIADESKVKSLPRGLMSQDDRRSGSDRRA